MDGIDEETDIPLRASLDNSIDDFDNSTYAEYIKKL